MQRFTRANPVPMLAAVLAMVAVTTACGAPEPPPPPPPTIGMLPTPIPTETVEPPPTRQPRTAMSSAASAPATPTPAPVVQRPIAPSRFTIGNTLGRGMALRAAPRAGEVSKTWPEGTALDGLGAEQDASGWTWSWVRDPDGNTGWVPTNYLVEDPAAAATRSGSPGLSPPSAPPTLIIVPSADFATRLP